VAAIGAAAFGRPLVSAAAEHAASAAVFDGKPLEYWTAQVLADPPAESVETIVDVLRRALESDDPQIKVTALDAFQSLGPRAAPAAPALVRVLEDSRAWIGVAAVDALAAIGKQAVPILTETFERGPAAARLRTLLVLGSLGPEAREALPVLIRAAASDADPLRERLAGTIAQIQGADNVSTVRAAVAIGDGSAAATPTAGDQDWPQFRGPRGDAICTETGLLTGWPDDGPPLLWQLTGLGKGYSTISIADGRFYTMGDRKSADGTESQFALAYDLATRRELWATRVGPPHQDGPRCTPTIADGRVYVLGTASDLLCLDAASGQPVWHKNLADDFGGQMMSIWKFSESPLVDGDRLICTPGGPDAALVALNKDTGETLWQCVMPAIGDRGKDGAGYASAVVAEIAGVRQYVQMLGRGVIGVEAATGRFLWGYNRIANTVANIPSAIIRGDYVFATTSYKTGAALLHIRRDGDQFRAEEVYFLSPRDFENHHGGVVLVGDHLYGGNSQNQGHPTCLNWASGEIVWKERAPAGGSAAVLYADGHVIFRYDRGLVTLVEATPEAYHVKAKFTPPTAAGPAWAHPVIHRGRLYLRHDDLLVCYDLRK
jgi:prepilin-type processing-associated H-X9-DG protein